jgi:3-hydroxybutyryl-CoA dehydrogenase
MDAGKTGMKAGEGYRKWSAQEISETRARYNTRLKAALAVLQMD